MRSLHARLIATYALLALVLLGAMGWIFSAAFINYAQSVRVQRVQATLGQVRARVAQSTKPVDQLLAELKRDFPGLTFSFYRVVVTSREGTVVPLNPDQPSFFSLFLRGPNQNSVVYNIAYTPLGLPVGTFAVQEREQESGGLLFRTFYREVGLVVAIGVGLAVLMGWLFSRWLSRPINRLTQATAAVADGDFLQTVKPTGTPELDGLAHQFNRMVQRLDDSFRSLGAERDVARRFASDAAHELKTPVTALKAYYETAVDRPERVAQVLPRMGRQIERVEGIIGGLLQLARLSEGTGLELTAGDLAETVRELEPTYRMIAREAGHSLEVSGLEQALPVRFDPRLLEIALTNLVTNACKFTPAPGEIRIAAARVGAEAMVAVTDTGPGIPESDLAHIFERFHRGTDTQSIPGSGLGLSIVQEAMGRMGGRVTVESEAGKGSRFALWLPLIA